MIEIRELTDQAVFQAKWQADDLHILQSWPWGQVKALEKWQILHLGAFEGEQLQAVVSLQYKQLAGSLIKFAYLPKLSEPNLLTPEVLAALKEFLTKHKFAFAILEFAEGIQLTTLEKQNGSLLPYFGHIQPQQTNLVKLARSEEEIFMGMDGKYRRNIKKAIREGVTIALHQYAAGSENVRPVEEFYDVLNEIMANTKFMGRGREYFQTIWNTLGSAGRARIFLAKWQDKIVGAYLVVNDNSGAYELYGGVTKDGRQVEAGYLLKWEAIRYYNNLGLKIYDHWGVAPKLTDGSYDPKDELYQISKFKEGFGGEFVQFPSALAMVISPVKFKLFLLAQEQQKAKLKLQKLFK